MSFADWLTDQLTVRGWNNSELARRAGVVPSTISMAISGQTKPGLDLCLGIGRAFGLPPETILRHAGLLPALPPEIAERDEVLQLLGRLSWTARRIVLAMLRGLARSQGILSEPGVPYDPTDPGAGELVRLYGDLPDEWRDAALEQLRQLSRIARGPQPPRIIGDPHADDQ